MGGRRFYLLLSFFDGGLWLICDYVWGGGDMIFKLIDNVWNGGNRILISD